MADQITVYWSVDHWNMVGDTYVRRNELVALYWTWIPARKVWIARYPRSVERFRKYMRAEDIPRLDEQLATLDHNYRMSNATALETGEASGGLYEYQAVTPVEFMNRNLLLADEMGLGKTIQAIACIDAIKPDNCLIVVPNALVLNWYDELAKWQTYKHTMVYIVPWSQLFKMDFSINWDMIIVDEAHYAKNPDSRRSKSFSALKGKRRMCLTGTPVLGKPLEIYPIINWIEPGMFGSYSAFKERYTRTEVKRYRTRYGWKYYNDNSAPINLPELQRKLRETIMISRKKNEVLTQLPAKTRTLVTMDVGKDVQKLDREIASLWDRVRTYSNPHEKMQARASIFEMRHKAALLKLPKINAFLDELLEEYDEPVVVWAHHHDVIDGIYNHLKSAGITSVCKADGRDAPDDRAYIVRQFQAGVHKVLVASWQALGVGVTLTAASVAVLAELSWTPAELVQAEDRLHRIGQEYPVTVYYLTTPGSVDKRIGEILSDKQRVIDELMNFEVE